jgi:hypothetical protein
MSALDDADSAVPHLQPPNPILVSKQRYTNANFPLAVSLIAFYSIVITGNFADDLQDFGALFKIHSQNSKHAPYLDGFWGTLWIHAE